ncbi:LuxR C-terminal-related transcriptional regulator [Actinoplanes sp. NPDC049599]|uniref:helix-turn-helix transcriptional regulator n=1 Tax=Actinoplanes sp. NPDC049599 TaxID=3363903 RepID=UPI0037947778
MRVTSPGAVPSLTRWGVPVDADLVYRALAIVGSMGETRLVRELGVTRVRVRSAVDELVARGLITTGTASGPRRSRVWIAAPVPDALGRLRPRPVRTAPHERWRDHFGVLDGLQVPALDDLTVRHWRSRALARRRAAHLVAVERHEHLTISTEEVISAESWAAALPLDQSLLDRGVRMRVLSRPPADGDRSAPPRAIVQGAAGICRQASDLPLKLMIFDRRVALLPSDPLDLEAGYVEVNEPSAVQELCLFFHRLWRFGRDPFREGVPAIDLTQRERALVALLAAGHTDVSAAEQMNVSARTVAYALRALMDRLGVENRFQLALLLGAAGAAPLPSTGHPDTPAGADQT